MPDVFDDDFVRGAAFIEPSADQRLAEAQRRQPRRRRKVSVRRALPFAGLAVVLALVGRMATDGKHTRGDIIATDAGEIVIEQQLADERILPAVDHSGDAFVFQTVEVGGRKLEARFNPCATIDVVWNLAGAPPVMERVVREAVEDVRRYSGLALELRGESDEAADMERELVQPERYGNRYAPVLIAWTSSREHRELEGEVAGVGAGIFRRVTNLGVGGVERVSGFVLLDADELERAVTAGRDDIAKAIVVHELGHVLGLGHSDDPGSIMFPSTTDITAPNSSDLAGFAHAGAASCQ